MNGVSLVLFHLLLACAIKFNDASVGCPGCIAPVSDPNADFIRKLMTDSLSQSNSGATLVNVKSCTSQTVAGVKYDCDVEVKSPSGQVKTCKIVATDTHWNVANPFTVISETCSQARKKRSLLGGLKDVDPSEKVLVQELASYAIKTLDDIDSDNNMRIATKVLSAKKQLVNGIMYHLKLIVRSTTCDETQEINDDCLKKDSEEPRICAIQLYRSFADNSPLNAKVVGSECDELPSDVKATEMGDYELVESNGEEVQQVAKYASSRISDSVNSAYVKKIVSVEKAETQLTSGVNYALTLLLGDTTCMKNKAHDISDCDFLSTAKNNLMCKVVIHKQPWEKRMKLSSSHCSDVPMIERSERSVMGCKTPTDVHSEEIKNLHSFIAHQITQRTNSPNLLRITNTLSASSQVVAGMLYQVKVVVARTECPANVNANPATCPLSNTPNEQICDLKIWDRPWLRKQQLTKMECHRHHAVAEDENGEELSKLATLLNVSPSDETFHQFGVFLATYEKTYPTDNEYRKRFSIFRANMKKVKYLQDTEQGTGQYGATHFADLSKSEFQKYLGFRMEEGRWPPRPQAEIPDVTLPVEYDWRDYGAVTQVKNQGMCGSCWAFSVTGNVEGQYAIQNKQLLSLSEQELVDCDKYDSGCNGGLFDSAFHALEDLGGLETEGDYPYEGMDDKCKFNSSKVKVTITSSVNISSNEQDMAKWLYKNGPISVALNANAMQFYMGGVSHPMKFTCSPDQLDHGVLIVGYGVHKTMFLKRHVPYWIIKNSWGKSWGNQGYYWLYRGDGSCGINKVPTSAVL